MQALFLGAGASYDCGMPLVSELTAEFKRWFTAEKIHSINQIQRRGGYGWSDATVAKLIMRVGNPRMHYENLIGSLEVEFSRERDVGRRQELHGLHAHLLQSIHGLLTERQIKNYAFAFAALDNFEGIKRLAEENRPLWVFSLNHDVMLEMLASKFSIPLKTGFHGNESIRMSSGDGVHIDLCFGRLSREAMQKNNYDYFKTGEYGINLIKLHGALDIFAQGDEMDYLKFIAPDGDALSYVKNIETLAKIDLALGQRHRVRAVNEHTYCDEMGVIQFLRNSLLSGSHKFSPRSTQIAPPEFLSLFSGCLNYAHELICVGYGFGDSHINEQMVEWLSFASDRRITIINPGFQDCPSRFAHLDEQVSVCSESASDYFSRLRQTPEGIQAKAFRALRARNRERLRKSLLESS